MFTVLDLCVVSVLAGGCVVVVMLFIAEVRERKLRSDINRFYRAFVDECDRTDAQIRIVNDHRDIAEKVKQYARDVDIDDVDDCEDTLINIIHEACKIAPDPKFVSEGDREPDLSIEEWLDGWMAK